MAAPECPFDAQARRIVLWLKEQRLEQGLSSVVLARRIGISRACISHLESGRHKPVLTTVLRISAGLGFSPADWP